ncbi:MAG: orotidine-5'-phosphate decarboxylase [Bacteroidales bacterium]|nr:orotidine-5'-phosphate decarboxylase [Bacteroidales bacterium]
MTRQELISNIKRKGSFLCVGLDPDIDKLPKHLLEAENPILEFNKAIIDATADSAVAYKPNVAFYECLGTKGWEAFEGTCKYIKGKHPDLFIIADAKRGDIGNTARMYARAFFDHAGADAVTVAPYMGEDSVKPFLEYDGKWAVVLALTSNKGSQDFQMIRDAEGQPLYQSVMKKSQLWGTPGNLMFVVGATQGALLGEARNAAPDSFFLVPGVGAQGGSLRDVAEYGMTDDCGLLVNSSRGIIFASQGEDFAYAANASAATLAQEMAELLKKRGII